MTNNYVQLGSDLYGQTRWDEQWRRGRKARRLPFLRYAVWRVLEVVRGHVAPYQSALEVGCGGGYWLALFAEQLKLQVYGLDYSLVGCQQAQSRLIQEGASSRIVQGDAIDAPYMSQAFDVVFSLGVVEHYKDPSKILEAMVALLKPGGTLVVSVPNMKGLNGHLYRVTDKELFRRHVLIEPKHLVRSCEALDLRVRYSGYVGTLYLSGPDWAKRIRWEKLALILRMLLVLFEIVVTSLFRMTRIRFESSHTSPYILVVAKRP